MDSGWLGRLRLPAVCSRHHAAQLASSLASPNTTKTSAQWSQQCIGPTAECGALALMHGVLQPYSRLGGPSVARGPPAIDSL